MDKKSKILLAGLGLAVAWSVAATYYRTMVARDFYTEQSEEEIGEGEEGIGGEMPAEGGEMQGAQDQATE